MSGVARVRAAEGDNPLVFLQQLAGVSDDVFDALRKRFSSPTASTKSAQRMVLIGCSFTWKKIELVQVRDLGVLPQY